MLQRWAGFLRRNRVTALDLAVAVDGIRSFLLEPRESLRRGEPFGKHWRPGGPWSERGDRTSD